MNHDRPWRIGVLTTHPIQYQVPWFRLLAQHPNFDLQVFYCLLPNPEQQGDGFGVAFEWDIPLLEGYPYQVLQNIAPNPSVTHFYGCDTPEIFQILKTQPWDAFIVNGWMAKSCLQLLAACRLHNVPCFVRGESNHLRPRASWKKFLQRILIHQYSAYLSIGQGNTHFYQDLGVRPELIFSTPYCVENDRFVQAAHQLRPQKIQLRQQFNLDPHAFTFLYCGKFIPKKHPLDLLQAIQQLKSQGIVGFQLLMVGDGELRAVCEGFVQSHSLPVQFSGFLNQGAIVQAYVAADCLVLPSDSGETWGLVVNEAMACGLPAIVSDAAGCHLDLIQPGQTGSVYPQGKVASLTQTLKHWIQSGLHTAQNQGEQAQHQILQVYTYQHVVQGIEQACNTVLVPRRSR